MSPKIKLTYFDIEGVAEPVRLALVLSGTDFEDARIKFDEWPALKAKTPGGQIPIMTIDDGPMRTQSKAMLRHIGSTYSTTLNPCDKQFDIEEAIGIAEDLALALRPCFYMGMRPATMGYPENYASTDEGKAKIKEMRESFFKNDLPAFLTRFTSILESHGGKFLVAGDAPTIADCFLVPSIRAFTRGHMDHIPTTCMDGHPKVVAYLKNFCALDGIKGRYTNGIF